MTTRINLCKNPSLEVDTTGYWNGTRVTTETYTGTASLQMGAGAANNRLTGYGATSGATANADAIPIAPGEQVTFSVYVKAAAPGPSIRLKIHWFNAGGGWISDHDNAAVVPGTSWTRLNITGATAPANAAKFGVVIFDWYGGSGGTIFADGWLVEKSATLGDYFDGSTTAPAGYTNAWTGAAHASTSTQTAAPASPTVTVKHYESGAWVSRTAKPKVYVNGAWVTKRPKRWNGTAWVDLN